MKSAMLLRKIDAKLDAIIHEDLTVLKKVKKHVIKSGGKRIRPVLHCYLLRILGDESDRWVDTGAIGELIHAASLLHDDVIDEAQQRRGRPAVHTLEGNKTTILAGDYLLACGFEHLSTLEQSVELLPVFTGVIRDLTVGELLQMRWESNPAVTVKTYEEIIHRKTASLFGAMAQSAGILQNQSKEEIERLRDFGVRMGRLFQIRDDYLDYFGDPKKEGKTLYQDVNRRLITFPLLQLMKKMNVADRRELKKRWAGPENGKSMTEFVMERMQKHEIRKLVALEMEEDIHRLMKYLREYPGSEFRDKLVDRLSDLLVPVRG
ncbi:MAG: geranylgeranyl pyrophosphate synthase [Leptospiraceae bacterium]|nr:geranylgeranyl pyrophosphate synthase [Leptospiraceae bacterium]